MVLPAPPADDAPDSADSWLAGIRISLRLAGAGAGLLILVDHACPERLGELVRSLLPSYPRLEVHTHVLDTVRVAHAAQMVLVPKATDADWLNIQRPIFARRALQVILWCDRPTAQVLALHAPDFFSWISHRYECPPAAPAHGVAGIQCALRARAPGVVWAGGDLQGCFQAARPSRALRTVSAALPYADLVTAVRNAGSAWIAWTDVDGPFRLHRVRWALAEAGRLGRTVLLEPSVPSPGWWPVHGKTLPIVDARERLNNSGAKAPGRLAALAGLEPEAVELVATLLEKGATEDEIEQILMKGPDPGAALARWGFDKGLVVPALGALQEASAPVRRAFAIGAASVRHAVSQTHAMTDLGPEPRPHETAERLLRERPSGAPAWEALADAAIEAGDIDAAVRWARHALDAGPERAESLLTMARALHTAGKYDDAADYAQRAISRAAHDNALTARARLALGASLLAMGKFPRAEDLVREALAYQQHTLGGTHAHTQKSLYVLAHTLLVTGKYVEAEQTIQELLQIEEKTLGAEHASFGDSLSVLALVQQARGRYAEAAFTARKALAITEKALGLEHPSSARCLEALAVALQNQGAFDEAEVRARGAVSIVEKLFPRNHPARGNSLAVLADILTSRGDYAKGESLLREALASFGDSPGVAWFSCKVLKMLGAVLLSQGKYAEAEAVLQKALVHTEHALGADHPGLGAVRLVLAMSLIQQGRPEDAGQVLEHATEAAQRSLGDEHPTTLHLRTLQAQIRAVMQDPRAPATAYSALEALFRTLGPRHPTTREAASILFSMVLKAWIMEADEASHAGDLLAIRRLSSIAGMAQQVGLPRAEGVARAALAQMLANVGQNHEALPHAQRALELALQQSEQPAATELRELIDKLTQTAPG